MYRKDAFLTLI